MFSHLVIYFNYLLIKISYQTLILKITIEESSHRVGIRYVVNTLKETVDEVVHIVHNLRISQISKISEFLKSCL